jgi:hypothetical protein
MELEQRIIIKFLTNEGLDAYQILAKLHTHFGGRGYALRTVRFWIMEARRGREDLHDEHRAGRPPLDYIDTAILRIIGKSPFESARSIAYMLKISYSAVLHHLHEVLGFKSFHLRWVSHLLTNDLRKKRQDVAREMISDLEASLQDGWRSLITGDEAWSFLSQSPRRMWSGARDNVATIVKGDIRTTKFMFTIMWNPREFHIINQLPDGCKMNSEYYITNVFVPLRERFCSGGPEDCGRPLVVHVENCSVHTSAAIERFMSDHRMVRMSQPPYSPNLAPSDFYLFGMVKNQLEQIHASDADDFFGQFDEILNSIPVEKLKWVFTAWIDRVRQVSEGNEDYLPE